LILDSDEKIQAQEWAQQFGQDLRAIDDGAAIRSLEPQLSTQSSDALWLPSVAQLRNPRLVKSLQGSLQFHQIDYAEQEAVIEIEQYEGRVVALKTSRRTIPADTVIITAGAWSGALLQQAGVHVDVEPVRGQMLVYRAVPDLLRHIILDQDRYLIPRRDGHVLIGSTLEYVGFDKSTTQQARDELSACAEALLPGLSDYPIEKHWAGLRPGSRSGIPYIGQHPDLQGLFFNCGHFRNGVILGLASVQLLIDVMLDRAPVVDPAPYALNACH